MKLGLTQMPWNHFVGAKVRGLFNFSFSLGRNFVNTCVAGLWQCTVR